MRKIIAGVLALTMMTGTAMADGWGGRRPCNFNGCYGGGGGYHEHYHGGGGGGNWAAPLVGGLIIGGMLGAMSQPRYYQEQPAYHTECRRQQVFDQYGNFIGYQRQCYNVPND